MSMERDRIPGQDHEPQRVSDVPDDARQNRTEGWGAMHYAVVALSLLMLFAGLLWVGELVGLLAAVLPGGLGPVPAALLGTAGLIGLGLLVFVIRKRRVDR